MIETKYLKNYYSEIVEDVTFPLVMSIDDYFHNHLDVLACIIKKQLLDFEEQLVTSSRVDDFIGVISISWLRSSYIIDGKLEYEFHSYGENWLYSTNQFLDYYQFDSAQKVLTATKQEIENKLANNGNPRIKGHVSYYHRSCFDEYQKYYVALLRYTLKKYNKELFQRITKANEFLVFVGEQMDISEQIYEERKLGVSQSEVEYLIENEDISNSSFLSNVVFTKLDYYRKQLIDVNFSNSQFNQDIFDECYFMNSNFSNADFQRTSFKRSWLHDTNFHNANCFGTNFQAVQGNISTSLAPVPSYLGIDFSNANLEQADFRGANLLGADFTNANMKEAVFLEKEQTRLSLSDKQMSEIRWVEA